MPSIDALRRLTQSLAVLDAIIQRDWDYRYYSFNSRWDVDEQMASMRNSQGDAWFCIFAQPGAFLKGFAHESSMSPWNDDEHKIWPGVLDNIPDVFKPFAKEPAFSPEDTTFCIWRARADSQWRTGPISFPKGVDPDGSEWMLAILDGEPNTYKSWAEEYYEKSIPLSAVEHIYSFQPLNAATVHDLNPSVDLEDLNDDVDEIGYPTK